MQEQERLTGEETELQNTLRRLKPARPGFDLSRIALEAQRRQSRQIWRWRGIAAVLAACWMVSSLVRMETRAVEKVVYVPSPATPSQFFETPPLQIAAPITRDKTDDIQLFSLSYVPR